MILEIKLSNFYSINEEVVLDLRAANISNKNTKNLIDHFFEIGKKKVLKTVAIYGANASGKSNIIKAIRWCCHFILNSHGFNQGFIFPLKPFKFNTKEKLSTFYIHFIHEEIEYEYAFSLDLHRHTFVKESLYYYPNGRKAKIFERNENKGEQKNEKYSFGQIIKRPLDVAENTSNKTLYLSRASQMDRHFAKSLYNYFNEKFILQYDGNRLDNIESYLQHEDAKKFLLDALQVADSDIIDIQHRKIQIPTKIPTRNIEILTFHKSNPDIVFDFFDEESDGTKKLFFVLLNIFDILSKDKILLIDEIETSLHPKIVEYILTLFHKSKKSQLIFTTHHTNLLNLKKMRKDQIYFVNKKQDASSDLYSLYDYSDFRETMDLEKAYLQGRFDAIPIMQD